MITKRIQRRNANILKYHEKGFDTRTIGRIFHLSHAQCANIIKKLKEQGKAELMDLEQRKIKKKRRKRKGAFGWDEKPGKARSVNK